MKKSFLVWGIYIVLSLCFNLLFSGTTSPLIPTLSIDSAIFQEIGLGINHGKIPYIDLFDHKGLYLYLIDALGLRINLSWGILLLQSLYMSACLIFITKIQSVIIGNALSFTHKIITALFFFLCVFAYEGSNLTEDWSLLFVLIPLYYFIKAVTDKTNLVPIRDIFVTGVCCGIISFLRLNNIFPIICFVCWILFYNIKVGKYQYILNCIITGISGLIIGVVPCFLFMYFRGGYAAIEEMIFACFTFNFLYASHHEYLSLLFALKSFAPTLFIVAITLITSKKDKLLGSIVCISIIIGLFVIGKSLFRHYFIMFIPLYVISLSLVFKSRHSVWYTSSIFLVMLIASINPILRYIDDRRCNYYEQVIEQFEHVIENIPSNERNQIWNYNITGLELFVSHDIVQMNHCALEGLERYPGSDKARLYKEKPLWLFYMKNGNIKDTDFLTKNYISVDSTDVRGYQLNVVLMKRR